MTGTTKRGLEMTGTSLSRSRYEIEAPKGASSLALGTRLPKKARKGYEPRWRKAAQKAKNFHGVRQILDEMVKTKSTYCFSLQRINGPKGLTMRTQA